MRRLLTMTAAAVLALAPTAGLAADDYPQQAYTTAAPNDRAWLALITLEGRWAVQVGDGCPWIASGMGLNVELSAPADADGATLTMPDGAEFGAGESCPITSDVYQSKVPCVIHDSVCDVTYD